MQSESEAQKNEKTIVEQKLNLTIKNYWLFGSALFVLMAAIIVWLGFKYYNRKQNLRMQLALAEEKRIAAQSIIDAEEQERKRIAADLHDNIGAYASAIRADVEKISHSGFSNSNVSLINLQQHSQEIINSLRDTIWVLNKDNITITGISDRIKNYCNKLQPSYDNIQLIVNENIQHDVRISSQYALNMFRIVQEAIHNALKHSVAQTIIISISSGKNINIQIKDDGKGLKENSNAAGNGLLNMRARAKEMGMAFSINTMANEGTVLTLQSGTTN
jgi:signal transduction histidine kinase